MTYWRAAAAIKCQILDHAQIEPQAVVHGDDSGGAAAA
jgi:hypothetical protein